MGYQHSVTLPKHGGLVCVSRIGRVGIRAIGGHDVSED